MKYALLVVLLAAMALSTGCAGYAVAPVMPPPGFLYSDIKAPLDVDVDKVDLGTKMGKASTESYLGLVSTGDAGIRAAAQNGGITTIKHIDYEMKNVLGLYAKFTTVVYGD